MMVQQIGVIGAGTMGSGIAQVCALSGMNVVMVDITEAALDKGIASITASLDRLVAREKLLATDRDAALARIKTSTQYEALRPMDLAIEAATENVELKRRILKQVDSVLQPGAIIATNTSSLSITRLAAATSRTDRFIGIHFFNPVPVMALVELIRGLQTSDETLAEVQDFTKRIGKTPVMAKNSPGFVVNRILCPMINEAIFALQEGLATAADVDNGMKLGCNQPIGPLALADMIGLDTMLSIMESLLDGFNDPKYRPAQLLKDMVAAGYLGKKSGRGFFVY